MKRQPAAWRKAEGGSGVDADAESVAPPQLWSLMQSHMFLDRGCSATAPEVTLFYQEAAEATCFTQEPKGFVSEMTQQSGYCGTEPELCGVDFLPAYPVCVRGGEEEANPSSVLEYSFYLDDQHGTVMGPVSPPDTTMIQRPCPFIPLPSPVTTIATAIDLNPAVSSPMTDSCSPICSMCNPTASDRDTLRSTSTSPGCSDRDPVCAAAHLHLLGESLSLIGHHLQQTDKMVCVSSSLSLLLDSLLCALAPITCLTAQIPELRSCTQHTLASTLENIAYVMPGL
ncbi:uncharacterized protein LOC118312497 isoform X3 [Scophthalmus maximus]|uniref:uncharacterized protein LOC118312497 isoform X3 n=1 Tax=Scophthalmus maximus TaxID=52904 RepID=UPI0015E1439E|nr:uncharacterized protein LOC118312497 isoform X3 [Scophthalmus maximus]